MKERLTYFDSLRGIAIIGVVLIHSVGFEDSDSSLSASVFLRQLVNFSVPLFIALSGYFLAVKKPINNFSNYLEFLKKPISRVYIPYLVWSLIFVMYFLIFSINFNLLNIIKSIIIFQTTPIFYFVALIIQYYFLAPFLLKNVTKAKLFIAAAVSFLTTIVINYYFHQNIPLIIYGGNAFTWIVFFYLGIYAKIYGFKINTYMLILLILVFYSSSIIETNIFSQDGVKLSKAVTAVKLSSFLYSTSIIILLLKVKRNWSIFSDLGKVSFGVFLSHLIFIGLFSKVAYFLKFDIKTLPIQILECIIVTLLSYLLCKLITRLSPSIAYKYFGI